MRASSAPAVEQVLRVARQVLVERVARADQDRDADGSPRRPARPKRCQVAGDGARIADADHGVEVADVDAELERVGGHDAQDLAVAQAVLDARGASLGR